MEINHLFKNLSPFLKRNWDRIKLKYAQNYTIYDLNVKTTVSAINDSNRCLGRPELSGKLERFTPYNQTNTDKPKKALLWNFSRWKRSATVRHLSEFQCTFIEERNSIYSSPKAHLPQANNYYVWGYSENEKLRSYWQQKNVSINRIEDGFIRSVGLGATLTEPLSLAIDGETLYFDARKPSNLEKILISTEFTDHPKLLAQASLVMELIKVFKLSKYNQYDISYDGILPSNADKKRILVLGQVEDDASIRFGGGKNWTNEKLLYLAKKEHPNAEIIYRPHPDVLLGYRVGKIKELKKEFTFLSEPVLLADLFNEVDHVYTITSLSGFEALLHNKPVTVVGYPFYAGWGLTDDRNSLNRRSKKINLVGLFAASYILYPRYLIDSENALKGLIATALRIHGERRIKTLQDFTRKKLLNAQEVIAKSNYWPLIFSGQKGISQSSISVARNYILNRYPRSAFQETVALKVFRRHLLQEGSTPEHYTPLSQASKQITNFLCDKHIEDAENHLKNCYLDNPNNKHQFMTLLHFSCLKKAQGEAKFILDYLASSARFKIDGEIYFIRALIELLLGNYPNFIGDASISIALDPEMIKEFQKALPYLPKKFNDLPLFESMKSAWKIDKNDTKGFERARTAAFTSIQCALMQQIIGDNCDMN